MIPTGTHVLFQGDSITDAFRRPEEVNDAHQLGSGYALIAVARLQASRPELGLRFTNRGISGHTLADLAARWDADCLDLAPEVLSILIGVNGTMRFQLYQDGPGRRGVRAGLRRTPHPHPSGAAQRPDSDRRTVPASSRRHGQGRRAGGNAPPPSRCSPSRRRPRHHLRRDGSGLCGSNGSCPRRALGLRRHSPDCCWCPPPGRPVGQRVSESMLAAVDLERIRSAVIPHRTGLPHFATAPDPDASDPRSAESRSRQTTVLPIKVHDDPAPRPETPDAAVRPSCGQRGEQNDFSRVRLQQRFGDPGASAEVPVDLERVQDKNLQIMRRGGACRSQRRVS